jgi:hypothetical protein
MTTLPALAHPVVDGQGIDELAVIVRNEIRQSQMAWSNALGHAMNAGDALIAVMPKLAERGINQKKWLRENCFAAVSTAQLYMQLARNRDRIEAELQRNVELSLRAARRLISKSSKTGNGSADETDDPTGPPGEDATETKPETLTEHWRRAAAERTTLLDDVGFAGVREEMSKEFAEDMRKAQPTKSICQHDTDTIVDRITETCPASKIEAIARKLLKFVESKRALSGAKRKNSGTSKPKGVTLKPTEYARQ